MGIIYNQQDGRSELQKRLAQELSDKAKKKNINPTGELVDGVDDSKYIEDTKQTTSLAWLWVLIGIAVVAVLIWLFVLAGNRS